MQTKLICLLKNMDCSLPIAEAMGCGCGCGGLRLSCKLLTDVTQNVKHPRFQRIFFGEYL